METDSFQEWSKREKGFSTHEKPYNHSPDVDIEGLSEEQCAIVRKMIEEEAKSLSKTDGDVGTTEELRVEINLTDSIAVQKKMYIYSHTTLCRNKTVCGRFVEQRLDSKVRHIPHLLCAFGKRWNFETVY